MLTELFVWRNRDEIYNQHVNRIPKGRKEMRFFKRYLFSIVALMIALIVLFWLLSMGRRAPGVVGTTSDKLGQLASGQAYSF
jgi:hypothetical protein